MRKLRIISIFIVLFTLLILLTSCGTTTDVTAVDTLSKNNFTYTIYYKTSDDLYYASISEYSGNETKLTIEDTVAYDSKDVIVTSIQNGAFSSDNKIESITLGKNIETIDAKTFMNFKSLKTVILNDKIDTLNIFLFSRSTIETITIPRNVKKISSCAFSKTPLKEIVILNNQIEIASEAFDYCDELTSVYFNGTKEEFNNIKVNEYNEKFFLANVYYYSDTKPSSSGNYWHYVDNTVTIW